MIRVLRQLLTVILSLILAVPAFSNSYDAVGNLANVTYPNGVVHSYGYDNRNRLTNLGVAKGAANLGRYAYVLDASGHRTQVTELNGRTINYGYDNLYRLTSEAITLDPAAVNGAVSYTYDAVGNRTQLTSTLAAVPAGLWNYDANDRFTAGDTYDNNGNTVSSGGIGNVYDFENRLIQKGGVTIVYDGDGNRVKKTVAGVTTTYLVDDLNPTGYAQVLTETLSGNGTGNRELLRAYVYGLERISQRRSFVVSGNTQTQNSFYVYDGHGSVRALTSSTGAVTDTYDYDAFGNLIHSTGATPNEFLFAGEQFDPDLHLYYNRARYLNVSTGRFWSMDSFEGRDEQPLTLHKYLYAGGDSVDKRDPSGNDFSIGEALTVAVGITILAAIPTAVEPGVSRAKVEIHFDEIKAFRRAHHAYLLVRNPLGLTQIFRGGPSSNGGGGLSEAAEDFSHIVPDSQDQGFGDITSSGSGEEFGPRSIDYPRGPGDDVASVQVPELTQTFQQIVSSFTIAAHVIDSLHIPYHPINQNSNSFAHTLLVKANLRSPEPPVWALGWDHVLY